MKQFFLATIAIVLLLAPLAAQTIYVTAPGGGPFCINGVLPISWSSSGVIGPLSIKLRPANAPSAPPVKPIQDSVDVNGSISWTIPGDVPPGQYQVRVRTVSDNPLVYTDSVVFEIKASGNSLDKFQSKPFIKNPGYFTPSLPIQPVAKPDLVVCKAGPGQLAQENLCEPTLACFNFILKIHNIGSAEAKECWVKIAFNGGGSASGTVSAIKPGESAQWVCVINTHLDGSLSDKYTVWIDEKNVVDEAEEGNNILAGALSLHALEPAKCSDGKAH